MLVLTDNTSTLEIDLASWDGDAYVCARVESRGFSGANDLHVHDGGFRRFCSDLIALQESLRGEAKLESISPDELVIRIKPFDSLGHIAVVGKFGYHVHTAHSMNWHSVEFGFEVDPQQLDGAVKVPWVKEYAF